MKILIVKLSAFGDIIHTLPALNDLLERPEVDEVHWLVDSRYAFVTGIFPPQVKVHPIDLKDSHQWWRTCRTIQSLRKKHFDTVLDLQGLIKSGLLARFISSHVFGIDAHYVREKPNRYFTHPVRFHPDEKHVVQQSRRVATAPFSKPFPRNWEQIPEQPIPYREPHVLLTPEIAQAAEIMLERWHLESGRYVWIHLGGGWETKQLPPKTWEAIANGLVMSGITPILGWGNEREQQIAQWIETKVKPSFLPEDRLEISSLCGVLSRAKAVIGADTGVLHLAAALGVPTVSFWGPSASWRSGPLGNTDQHIESSPACGPCFKRTCKQFVCMDMISADDILAAIDDVSSSR